MRPLIPQSMVIGSFLHGSPSHIATKILPRHRDPRISKWAFTSPPTSSRHRPHHHKHSQKPTLLRITELSTLHRVSVACGLPLTGFQAAMAVVTRVSHRTHSGISPTSGLALACHLLLLVSSAITPCFGFSGVGGEDEGNRGWELYPEILRDEAVARLHQLGKVSDGDGYLERIFMSPAAVRAGNLIREWMEDAGLQTWVDCLGNVHGRVEGKEC